MNSDDYRKRLQDTTATKTTAKTDDFFQHNGLLFRKTRQGPRRVLRTNEAKDVLIETHSGPMGAHFKIGATTRHIKQRYWWPNMDHDIREHVQSCDPCQRKGPPKRTQELCSIPIAGEPFKRIGIDYIGRLPKTANGNRYVIVAIDYFTKWAEARATPDSTAKTTARFIYEEIILRHGCPQVIQTDNGTSFNNQLMAELSNQFSIRHSFVSPYHPQANGLVERLNRTIKDSINKYVQHDITMWDHHLSGVLFGYRALKQASTGYSPMFLLYGREARLPIDLEFPAEVDDNDERISERIVKLVDQLERHRERAEMNLAAAQQRQKRNYDKKVTLYQFQIGDKVLLLRDKILASHSKAFEAYWEGPYYIQEISNVGLYKLRSEPTKCFAKFISGDRLKLYKDPPSRPRVLIEPTSPPTTPKQLTATASSTTKPLNQRYNFRNRKNHEQPSSLDQQ